MALPDDLPSLVPTSAEMDGRREKLVRLEESIDGLMSKLITQLDGLRIERDWARTALREMDRAHVDAQRQTTPDSAA